MTELSYRKRKENSPEKKHRTRFKQQKPLMSLDQTKATSMYYVHNMY